MWFKRLSDIVGAAEIVMGIGLVLIACGLWSVSRAAALTSVGVVLVWLSLPPRAPFIQRK